jgi:hypothetical protein
MMAGSEVSIVRRISVTLVVLVALVMAAMLIVRRLHPAPRPPIAQPIAATRPATQPTTRKASKPKYPSYMEVIRAMNPAVAATQPLDYPLDLEDSAHLVFHDPVYLDPIGHLWITRSDGQPTAKALLKPADELEHIITDQPVFVHWAIDARGKWIASVVVHGEHGGFDIITKAARKHLADDKPYNWPSAFSVLGKIVVCTDVGVSVFDVEPQVVEHYHVLPGSGAGTNPPVTMLDTRGVLAWSPWENGKPGSTGVSRFVDGGWIDLPVNLPGAEWPAKPIQLSLLLDGSVLCMGVGADEGVADQVHLTIGQIEPPNFDQTRLDELIKQLNDADGDVRQAAFDELSRYGPAIAPPLEKVVDQQLPAARTRIRQLLHNKITPALGGLTLVDGRLQVARRSPDGTVIFYAPAGVEIPNEHDEPDLLNPAWLALRPDGRMERPLTAAIVIDQKPEACTLISWRDEWIVNDALGPRRLVGPRYEPLLTDSEKRFSELVGVSLHHRWVFRDPGVEHGGGQSVEHGDHHANADTLVIDPNVADPTPKLPAWVIVTTNGTAGWDDANFPAVRRPDEGGTWELNDTGWKALDAKQKVITELPPAIQPATDSVTQPATDLAGQLAGQPPGQPTVRAASQPTSQPATLPTSQPAAMPSLGKPILTTQDGTRFYDGKNTIVMVKNNAAAIRWPLPAAAVGSANPTLVQTSDGRLFLFNEPGRLLRILPTPMEVEPFKLEATFTKDIPNEIPTRMWLDPAGRIDFVSQENVLTITFPEGSIPKEMSRMMLDAKHE